MFARFLWLARGALEVVSGPHQLLSRIAAFEVDETWRRNRGVRVKAVHVWRVGSAWPRLAKCGRCQCKVCVVMQRLDEKSFISK